MRDFLSKRVVSLEPSGIRKFFDIVSEMPDAISLGVGEPDFDTPWRVREEGIYSLERGRTFYTSNAGLKELRYEISEYLERKYELVYDPNHEITVTVGGSEGIDIAMRTILDPGDEVIVVQPCFVSYVACVVMAGGTPVIVSLKEEDKFKLKKEQLEAAVTDKTKAIVIINPNNPTGVLYPKELLLEIIQIARESGLLIFADEIYDRLVMDGKQHISLASLTEDVPVITLNGLSKSHCLCGYRCGWMVISGPRELTEDYRQGIIQLTSLRLCANTMAQIVIPAALDDMETPASMVRPGGRIYEQREATVRELEKIDGLSFIKNDAAFYVFPKLDVKKFNITNDKQFAHDLLDVTNILLVPGSGFDWKDPDHFRIVMLPQADILSDAIRRMGTFLDGYKQK